MKRFMPFMFVPFVAVAACGDDGGTDNPDVTSPSETTETTQETSTPGVSPLTGVNTAVSGITEPERNAGCDDNKVLSASGAKYPWGGATINGTTYTCNGCPNGHPDIQGTFRGFGFEPDEETSDYSKGADASSDDADLLVVDGNTWYSEIFDIQTGTTQIARGWYFCSQKPEHPNEHVFWTTTAGDEGPGSVSRSNVVLAQGNNQILMEWFYELTGQQYTQIAYCRVGSTLGDQVCNNPFE